MKKISAALLGLCLFASAAKAQNSDDEIVIEKGSSLINVYYGPVLSKGLYKLAVPGSAASLNISALGPVGLVYEYLLMEEMGLGCELSYSELSIKYAYTDNNNSYSEEIKLTTTRVMLRAAYHFVEDKHIDVYAFVSAGYRGRKLTYTTTDPGGASSFTSPLFIPFGIKPGGGIRYYFIKNVGLHAEVALGSPFIAGGLSFRF